MSLADQKGGLGADEAPVVLELGFAEVTGQDGVDHALSPVQVLLQLSSVFGLAKEERALVIKGVLRKRKTNTYIYISSLFIYFKITCQ